VKQISQ